jgi:hypothetical protein
MLADHSIGAVHWERCDIATITTPARAVFRVRAVLRSRMRPLRAFPLLIARAPDRAAPGFLMRD